MYGDPTNLPWGLEIAPEYRIAGYERYATFHPTFLYELVWDLPVAAALILLDRRFRLGRGKVFMLYMVFYTAGRAVVERLRIDPAHTIGGFRLNDYVSVAVFLAALICFAWLVKNKPGREEIVEGDVRDIQDDGPLTGDQADVPAAAADQSGARPQSAPPPSAPAVQEP